MKKFLFLLVFLLPACALKHQQLGPEIQGPELTENFYVASDGKRLALTRWEPEREPFAILLALHGFNDYRMAFELPGKYWAQNGVLTIAFDQRGFGEDDKAGAWADKDALKHDVLAMLNLIRVEYPGKPVFVLGESMGAAVALYSLAGVEDVKEVFLVAPAVWGWRWVNIVVEPSLWVTAKLLPGKKFSGKNLNIAASDNHEELKKLSQDPLVIKKTRLDAIYGLTRLMKAGLKSAPDIKARNYIIYGDQDEVIPVKMFKKLRKRIGGPSRAYKIHLDGYHLMLRDCQAMEVWNDILLHLRKNSGLSFQQTDQPVNLCREKQ